MIGGANRFFVVLDHDDRIPEIAQPAQGADEPRVVALMQPDARLVEHIEHAGQAGADLRREPDALRFAAGKRAALAIEREIIEPDFEEKFEPRRNLVHDFGDNRPLLLPRDRAA